MLIYTYIIHQIDEYVKYFIALTILIILSLNAKILTYQGSTREYVIIIFLSRTFHSRAYYISNSSIRCTA